jgi:hypothetical protein
MCPNIYAKRIINTQKAQSFNDSHYPSASDVPPRNVGQLISPWPLSPLNHCNVSICQPAQYLQACQAAQHLPACPTSASLPSICQPAQHLPACPSLSMTAGHCLDSLSIMQCRGLRYQSPDFDGGIVNNSNSTCVPVQVQAVPRERCSSACSGRLPLVVTTARLVTGYPVTESPVGF